MLSIIIMDKLNSIPKWNEFWNNYYKTHKIYTIGPAATTTSDEEINIENIKKSIDLFITSNIKK